MTDTLTLAQLRTRVRERADMVNSTFVTDAELNGYIDFSYKEFYDLLVAAVQDFNITELDFTITTGNTYSLPARFYKIRGLDDMSTSPPKTVRKFNFNERNDYVYPTVSIPTSGSESDVSARIINNVLYFYPPASAARSYHLWYVPTATPLASDGDTAEGVNGWLEYVIIDAAMKCLIKEESDIKPLMMAKQAIIARINDMRAERDQAQPEKISRIRNKGIMPKFGVLPGWDL